MVRVPRKWRGLTGVCVYSPFPRGGHPRYTQELCEAVSAELATRSVPLHLVSSIDLEATFWAKSSYAIHRIIPPLPEASATPEIGSIIRRAIHTFVRDATFLGFVAKNRRITVVHLQEIHLSTAWLTIRLLRLMGLRVVATVHNVLPHSQSKGLLGILSSYALTSAYRATSLLIVHSEKNHHSLMDLLGRRRDQLIKVIPHGLWTAMERPEPTDEAHAPRRNGRGLLFFGAIRENKGLHLLLQAVLQYGLSGYSLLIAGQPVDVRYFNETVMPLVNSAREAGLKVQLRAEFVAEDEVDDLVASHCAMVLPYLGSFQAQSGAAILSLSNRVPLIATGAGGIEEIMVGRRVGVMIREETPWGVSKALQEFSTMESDPAWKESFANDVSELSVNMSWRGVGRGTVAAYEVALQLGVNS